MASMNFGLRGGFKAIRVSRAEDVVTSSPQVIEHAVSRAWTRFMHYQPDREQNWQGWLFRVAQHEAWILRATERNHASLHEDGRH